MRSGGPRQWAKKTSLVTVVERVNFSLSLSQMVKILSDMLLSSHDLCVEHDC
ncbi:unnamed protein product [Amoebophrya sp. A120]|nr:unnamed protein product [Amoebophrya sp. A120]|eukprot:GSA120T00000288001.1